MKDRSPKRPEIFLLLALQHLERKNLSETLINNDLNNDIFTKLAQYLTANEVAEFQKSKQSYQDKTVAEKQLWQTQIKSFVKNDKSLLDDKIHWTHIEKKLGKENFVVRRILKQIIPPKYSNQIVENNIEKEPKKSHPISLDKNICIAFAKQFVAQNDLSFVTDFDRLDGIQIIRLVRLAGIREVALACGRIEAVESVTAFLRYFATEEARAIVAQMSNTPKISEERGVFAEDLVQTALEMESKSGAMLSLLGTWLIGILLCSDTKERIDYTIQKFPLEVKSKLKEIIESQRRRTNDKIKSEIGLEVEKLATKILSTENKKK